jgi:hypothetical protein
MIQEALHDIVEISEEFMKSAVAGKILPFTARLWTIKTKYKDIASAIKNLASPAELILLIVLGWTAVPILQYPYNKLIIGTSPRSTTKIISTEEGTHTSSSGTPSDTELVSSPKGEKGDAAVAFHESILFLIADHIARASKVAVLIYFIDCIAVTLKTLGFNVKNYSQIIKNISFLNS